MKLCTNQGTQECCGSAPGWPLETPYCHRLNLSAVDRIAEASDVFKHKTLHLYVHPATGLGVLCGLAAIHGTSHPMEFGHIAAEQRRQLRQYLLAVISTAWPLAIRFALLPLNHRHSIHVFILLGSKQYTH